MTDHSPSPILPKKSRKKAVINVGDRIPLSEYEYLREHCRRCGSTDLDYDHMIFDADIYKTHEFWECNNCGYYLKVTYSCRPIRIERLEDNVGTLANIVANRVEKILKENGFKIDENEIFHDTDDKILKKVLQLVDLHLGNKAMKEEID